MKIILIITGLKAGGAERLVCNLADEFVDAGHYVKLVSLADTIELKPVNNSVQIHTLGTRKSPLSLLSAIYKLRNIISDFHPDIINSHLVHANFLAGILKLFQGDFALVCSAHNTEISTVLHKWSDRLSNKVADYSTNISDEAVQSFIDKKIVDSDKMVTILNGIHTDAFSFNADARRKIHRDLAIDRSNGSVILAAGRLTEQKDYPNLLRALARLNKEGRKFYLLIAGEGPLKTSLIELAKSLEIDKQVEFLGTRSDMPALMSSCDIFVLSSAWEGAPLVVAEALACERLVVATDNESIRDFIQDNGFIVPTKDDKALAHALESAMDLPEGKAEKMRKRARHHIIENYSIAATAKRYLDLYKKFI